METNVVPFLDGINAWRRHITATTCSIRRPGPHTPARCCSPCPARAMARPLARRAFSSAAVTLFGLLAGARAPIVTDALAHLPLFGIASIPMNHLRRARFCVLATMGLEPRLRVRVRVAGGGDAQPATRNPQLLAWLYLGTAAAIGAVIAMTRRH